MTFKTTVEARADRRIFAGNDDAHTATGSSGLTAATPKLTPLMLDAAGKLVAWDGKAAGMAVGVLALDISGKESVLTYYKSGTFVTGALLWPDGVAGEIKTNAFVGTAISHC
ncbi:head decoration protein [Salmonella enterica subsp. enterica]|nr:head decoration protein [Salmonella enterica subsp. enterica serovar Newport]EAB5692385.1 head decoration protein [Salmonella enterica subsp. enterica serovar Newport]ECA9705917.1 head decoration protein [Salmonella enterica subsp. enterica serovar Bredeney]EEB7955057.1 head decoration protein [Salmonella enterica subsp. enterica serovar Newport]